MKQHGRAIGLGLLGAGASALVTWLLLLTARSAWLASTSPATPAPDDLLTCAAASVAAVLTAWLGLSTASSALAHVPGLIGRLASHVADRVAPAAVRRTVAFLVSTTLAGALAPGTALAQDLPTPMATTRHTAVVTAAASATDPAFRPTLTPATVAPARVDPGFRPVSGPSVTAARAELPATAPAPRSYIVRRGDSLWQIAASELGPRASNAAIAARWQDWYAVNRRVIGPDPDHLEIGTTLAVPAVAS